MFIVNPEKIKKKIKVSKKVGDELINKYKIPILSRKKNNYYFAHSERTKKLLESKEKKGVEEN